jgi:D-lactate dehydrogenase
MRILFYDAANYDKESFQGVAGEYQDIEITYEEVDVNTKTAFLAEGYDAICAFVNSDLSAPVLEKLTKYGIKLILLRCAGFNNVDLNKSNELGMTVLRVTGYSPEAVA